MKDSKVESWRILRSNKFHNLVVEGKNDCCDIDNLFVVWKKYFVRSLLAANVHIDLNTLLFGSQIYNIDTNRHVFITVQTYIKETCRFYKTKMGYESN
jgi:hypothetical protein